MNFINCQSKHTRTHASTHTKKTPEMSKSISRERYALDAMQMPNLAKQIYLISWLWQNKSTYKIYQIVNCWLAHFVCFRHLFVFSNFSLSPFDTCSNNKQTKSVENESVKCVCVLKRVLVVWKEIENTK